MAGQTGLEPLVEQQISVVTNDGRAAWLTEFFLVAKVSLSSSSTSCAVLTSPPTWC